MEFIGRSTRLLRALVCSVALASSAAGQELVDQVRDALGVKQNDATWQLSGTTTKNSLPAFFRWTFAPEGFFLQELRGPFPERVSFNGEKVWKVEGRSPSYSVEFLERERTLACAWLISGGWCHPNSPFEILTFNTYRFADPVLVLRLRDGLLKGTLEVAPKTHLPIRFEFDDGFGGRIEFLEWQEVEGKQIPKRVCVRTRLNPQYFEVESALPWKRELPSYGEPKASGTDTEFDAAQGSEVKVRRTSTGALFVRPLIDGRDVGWFLLDVNMGATVLTRSVAEELKLGSFGETTIDLPGVSEKMTVFRQGHALQLGPLRIDAPVFVECERFEVFDSWLAGEKCAGALGWDVFLRAVVEMDPAEGRVRLFDPKDFKASTPWHELKLHARRPYLHARFADVHEGWFRLDTSTKELTADFEVSAAIRLGLFDPSEEPPSDPKTNPIHPVTLSKGTRTLAWFESAGSRFEPALVSYGMTTSDRCPHYTLGVLGRGFLGTAPLSFDYQNSRMSFVPRK